jgi:hypothetical protein
MAAPGRRCPRPENAKTRRRKFGLGRTPILICQPMVKDAQGPARLTHRRVRARTHPTGRRSQELTETGMVRDAGKRRLARNQRSGSPAKPHRSARPRVIAGARCITARGGHWRRLRSSPVGEPRLIGAVRRASTEPGLPQHRDHVHRRTASSAYGRANARTNRQVPEAKADSGRARRRLASAIASRTSGGEHRPFSESGEVEGPAAKPEIPRGLSGRPMAVRNSANMARSAHQDGARATNSKQRSARASSHASAIRHAERAVASGPVRALSPAPSPPEGGAGPPRRAALPHCQRASDGLPASDAGRARAWSINGRRRRIDRWRSGKRGGRLVRSGFGVMAGRVGGGRTGGAPW